jgi:hypothetical protein
VLLARAKSLAFPGSFLEALLLSILSPFEERSTKFILQAKAAYCYS